MSQDARTAMLARLSDYAYAPGKDPPPGFELVNGTSFASGLSAVALRHQASGEVIVSYRGTANLANVASWPGIADTEAPAIKSVVSGVLNMSPNPMVDVLDGRRPGDELFKSGQEAFQKYVTEARDFARRTEGMVREANPEATVTYTGHSLGGALAQVEAARSGAPAVTFNAPGMSEFVRTKIQGADTTQIVNFRREGDLVSEVGTHAGRVVTHPAATRVPGDLLTEHSQSRYVQDLESGMKPVGAPKDGYLSKPVNLDEATKRLFDTSPGEGLGSMSTAAGVGLGMAAKVGAAAVAGVGLSGAAMAASAAPAVGGVGGPSTATAAMQEAGAREQDAEASSQAAGAAADQSKGAREQSTEQSDVSDAQSQQSQGGAAAAGEQATVGQDQAAEATRLAGDTAATAGTAGASREEALQQAQAATNAAQGAAEAEGQAREQGARATTAQQAAAEAARESEQRQTEASAAAARASEMAGSATESRAQAEQARTAAQQAQQECESLRSAVESLLGQVQGLRQEAEGERTVADRAREEALRARDETQRLREEIEGLMGRAADAAREAHAKASESAGYQRDASSASERAAACV